MSRQTKQRLHHASDSKDYAQFEKLVHTLYESLGFKVEHDTTIGGQQIDLVISKSIPGIGHKMWIVECKWTQNKSISNQEVYNFSNYIGAMRQGGDSLDGIMVTNASYSASAQKAAESNPNLNLKTLTDLERSVFDASEAMSQISSTYENMEIFNKYIRLSGRLDSQLTGRVRKDDITDFIVNEIKESGKSFTVFGDFGSGKTTLLEKIQYELANAYLRRSITGVPIIVKLKELERYGEKLLQHSVRRNTLISLTEDKLQFAIDNSMLILLLDGFDEISSSATELERIEYLDRIGKFTFSNCPTVLTCRPTYFTSRREFHSLTSRYSMAKYSLASTNAVLRHNEDFVKKHTLTDNKLPTTTIFEHTIDIAPLSDESIDRYLDTYKSDFKQNLNANVKKIKRFLSSVYDLKDLMSRPILLQMIIDTLLMGKMDISDSKISYGPSSVYSLYTGTSLERDYQKSAGSQYLTSKQREKFCRILGTYFSRNEVLEISSDNLKILIEESKQLDIFPKSKPGNTEKLLTDIRICSFLRTAENEDLLFTHKSFSEFFTALEFIESLVHDEWKEHLDFNFNLETILFLSSFIFENNDLRNVAFSQIRNKNLADSAQRNLICAICSVPDIFPNLRLRERVISDIKFPTAIYKNYTLEGSRFTRVRGNKMKFEKCKFEKFELNECETKEIDLVLCQGNVRFVKSDIFRINVRSKKLELTFENSSIDKLTISDHQGFRFAGDFWCQKFISSSTLFLLRESDGQDVQIGFKTVEATRCRFQSPSDTSLPSSDFLKTKSIKLNNNTFVGLSVTAKCLENSYIISKNENIDTFKGNRGLLFVDGKMAREIALWVKDNNPDLIVWEYDQELSNRLGRFSFYETDITAMKGELDDKLDRKVFDQKTSEFAQAFLKPFFSSEGF